MTIEGKKKILGPIEWFGLLLGLALLGYIVLGKNGCKVYERSEETKFIDPARSHQLTPADRSKSATDKEVDQMLEEIAMAFGDPGNPDFRSLDQIATQHKGQMSSEEIGFYDKIRKEYQVDEKVRSTADWLKLLRASRNTYLKVKDLFEELSPEQNGQAIPEKVLENEAASADFYQRIQQNYGLSREDIDDFAQKGKQSLEDWAVFLSRQAEKR